MNNNIQNQHLDDFTSFHSLTWVPPEIQQLYRYYVKLDSGKIPLDNIIQDVLFNNECVIGYNKQISTWYLYTRMWQVALEPVQTITQEDQLIESVEPNLLYYPLHNNCILLPYMYARWNLGHHLFKTSSNVQFKTMVDKSNFWRCREITLENVIS